MAKKTPGPRSRNGYLEEALAHLINNQAAFVGQLARMDERFARIESELAAIKSMLLHHEQLLLHHQQMLEALPEAIRQKIGFKKS